MPDNSKTNEIGLTRRKILGSMGAVGAAGAGAGLGTSALFSDQEQFANNQIEAGELDLKVDWEVKYYNSLVPDPETISDSDTDGDGDLELVDELGPIVDLQDVKPGDVVEHTLSLHLFGNPGFITMDGLITADSDNGITEPEDQVDGALNDADGTSDGDLDNHLQCVVWFDDGDGLPQEILNTSYSQRDAFIEDLIDGNVSFDTNAEEFLFQGTLASLMSTLSGGLLLDPRVNGHVANDYPNSFCFQPSITAYIGILCWLPRDIPGVNDNIVQSDRLTYELGFNANQCRNNITDDGRPEQRPTAGVQPLTFEVTEGFGTLGGGPVDLQSDVGFNENMVTSVDTSGDPVEFRLDLPDELDKSAGDQWSLVFDADDDGTVDFRVVFDEFFYQEWDNTSGEWNDKQDIPSDMETDVTDGIYTVKVPKERLSDPFSFGGRLIYREPPVVSSFEANEELAVSLTPTLVPRGELGPETGGFERLACFASTARRNTTEQSSASVPSSDRSSLSERPGIALLSDGESRRLWDEAKETAETQDVLEVASGTYGLNLDTSHVTAHAVRQGPLDSHVLTVPLTDGRMDDSSLALYTAYFDDKRRFQMAGIFVSQNEIGEQRITHRVTQSFSHVQESARRDASAVIRNGKLVEFQDPEFASSETSTGASLRKPAHLSGPSRLRPQHGSDIQFSIAPPERVGLASTQLSLGSTRTGQLGDWTDYLDDIACGACTGSINTIVSILSSLGCNWLGIGAAITVGGSVGTASGGPGAGTAGGATVGGVLASVLCGFVSQYSVESITEWASGLTDCCICYFLGRCEESVCSEDCPCWMDEEGSVPHGSGTGPQTGDETSGDASTPEPCECTCVFSADQLSNIVPCECNEEGKSACVEVSAVRLNLEMGFLECQIDKIVISGVNKCEGGCYGQGGGEEGPIEYSRSTPEEFGDDRIFDDTSGLATNVDLRLPCVVPPPGCEPILASVTIKKTSRPDKDCEMCKNTEILSMDRYSDCPDAE